MTAPVEEIDHQRSRSSPYILLKKQRIAEVK